MINNSPQIRLGIYFVAIAVGAIAIVLEAIPTPWAETAADGAQNLTAYLLTLIGVTAATNLTAGNDVKLLETKTTVTKTTLDD